MFELRRTPEDVILARLVDQIRQGPGQVMRLPEHERKIAELAMAGEDAHSIAQRAGTSEAAVWDFLESLARSIVGALPERPREVAGMGSDLDPGVTGGYGDTGFEPPEPVTEEEEQ